jgi:hypothetical protein
MVPPLAVNYVIGVEHQIPWKLVVGADYSGSRSFDGLTGTDSNLKQRHRWADGNAVLGGQHCGGL